MKNLDFRSWLLEAALPVLSDKEACQTSCPNATVVWLITLRENWQSLLKPAQVEIINNHLIDYENEPSIEGLQYSKSPNFKFYSKRLEKEVSIIPQEEEVRGLESAGVRPLDGFVTIRPRETSDTQRFGTYVGQDNRIQIPAAIIKRIKAIGGCALTCLHLSGGHVTDKTVGGYKKTFLYKTNRNKFYNTTLLQYFQSALMALAKKCSPTKNEKNTDIDYYAIRLNGTTDLSHHANGFTVDENTLKLINRYINSINRKRKLNFNTTNIDTNEPRTIFDVFNILWSQATKKLNCDFKPAFVQFYDYTARPDLKDKFIRKELPKNYHVTFSAKEGNYEEIMNALHNGMGIALPIWIGGSKKTAKVDFPKYWYPDGFGNGQGYKIVDGDSYDARFLDRKMRRIGKDQGYIIGLRAKGKLEDIQSFDTGFAERILQNYQNPSYEDLVAFSTKYNNKVKLDDPFFLQIRNDFINLVHGTLNPRFDPNDPAVNRIIYEQILYTLRRNNIPVNNLSPLSDKQFYHGQEQKGIERLIDIKDLDPDFLHSDTYAGRSSKTDKGNVGGKQTMSGSSSKVEKNAKYKVSTNQTNMVPHHTFASLYNSIGAARKAREQLSPQSMQFPQQGQTSVTRKVSG